MSAAENVAMRSHRLLSSLLLAACVLAIVPTAEAMAARVELLNGTIRSGDSSHRASGRAAVVQINGSKRVLTLKNFSIRPGGKVLLYLVPRSARSDRDIARARNHRVLGEVRGSRGNAQFTIPRRVDLRRFNSVVFWCVPFTLTLGRANLGAS